MNQFGNLAKFLTQPRLFRIDVSGTICSSVFRSLSRHNSHSFLRGSKSPTRFVRHQLIDSERHGISHAGDRETHWRQVRGGIFCCHGRVSNHCEHSPLGAQQPRERRETWRWNCPAQLGGSMWTVAGDKIISTERAAGLRTGTQHLRRLYVFRCCAGYYFADYPRKGKQRARQKA